MRVAWFTPAGDGEIAEYSRGVLRALMRLCEPHLFCDRPPARFPASIPVTELTAGGSALPDLASFDAVFYNLGNDFVQHAWIFDVARLHPGIVVLHDLTLHQLFLDYYRQHVGRPDLYIARMAEHYGIDGLTTAHHVLGPSLGSDSPRVADDEVVRYPFIEEALRPARGVVVHSHADAEAVRRLWAGPVCHAWLPAQRPTASSAPAAPLGDDVGDAATVVVTVSPADSRAGIAEVVEVLAGDPELAAGTVYAIVGAYDSADPYVRELSARVAASGLGRTVRLLGDLPPPEVDEWARAADLFINLRYPDDRRLLSLMYQLPFGKPVITYEGGSVTEVPQEAVVTVPIGDRAGLHRNLCALVDSGDRRREVGVAARKFAHSHTERDYARALVRFAGLDLRRLGAEQAAVAELRTVAEQFALHVGEMLAGLGATADKVGVDTVVRETAALLWPAER